MGITKDTVWHRYPSIALPSPILALGVGAGGIWAGGVGGIAWLAASDEWQPRISGLPLFSVTALEYLDGWLIAGGTDGIARSNDGGATWQKASLQEGMASITALVASPHFLRDKTMLAATLESGIMRTEDGGQTWLSATFGLQSFEVNALVWGEGETVIAATVDGLYRSSNGGRAWRFIRESGGISLAALAFQPDGTLLAASETEGLLRSTDGGTHWQPFGEVPEDVQSTALWVTPTGSLLLGTTSRGLLRSTHEGTQWEEVLSGIVLSFGSNGKILYAGTNSSVSVSIDDGVTWRALPYPPIHDLRHLLLQGDNLFLSGAQAGLLQCVSEQEWQTVQDLPYPITATTVAPDGSLFVSGLVGLLRSTDSGRTWHTVIPGEPGNVAHFAFSADGPGCAGSMDGVYLHRTLDGGKTWQPLAAPFGILPLASLLITEDALVAVNYDPRQYNTHIWRSLDKGDTWQRELEAQTTWPLVSSYNQPPLITMADSVLLQEGPGQWKQIIPEDGAAIRRVIGSGTTLFVLTTAGILRSNDGGKVWRHDDDGIPTEEVLDIGVTEQSLYVLLTDGRVWSRSL